VSAGGFFDKSATVIDRSTGLLAEKRNRSGVAVQVTGVADRTDLTVAENPVLGIGPNICASVLAS